MESVRVPNSTTERIYATALNSSGAPITALSNMLLEICRLSDGYYFDFNDSTFKNTGWVARTQIMSELSAAYSPGVYYYDWDTTGHDDNNYFLRVTSATAVNDPIEGELKVGGFIDDLAKEATLNTKIPTALSFTGANVNADSKATAAPADMALDSTVAKEATLTTHDTDIKTDIAAVPTAAEVDTQLTSSHGAGAWTGSTAGAIADAVLEELIADHSGVSGSLAEFISLIQAQVLQLRNGNIRRTFYVATVVDAVRKVAVGRLDRVTFEVKADGDADWSSPVSTKTLYAHYTTQGDTNPYKLGEDA